jgi:hypothetical protein
MEMVGDPSVLFLDEPTSGLDSTTSFELVEALHAIANKGCNVITVLHQPSYPLYQMFTKVLLVGKGGRTVFLGMGADALGYFRDTLNIPIPDFINPADYFMDCIAAKYKPIGRDDFTPLSLFPLWDENRIMIESKVLEHSGGYRPWRPEDGLRIPSTSMEEKEIPGALEATLLFMWRCGIQTNHQISSFIGECMQQFVAGFFVGFIYKDFNLGSITQILLMYPFCIGLTIGLASLKVFGNERVVFWREATLGSGMALNAGAYFMAKNLMDVPRLFMMTLCTAVAFYPQVSPLQPFWDFLMMSLSGTWAVSGMAYLISIAMDKSSSQLMTVVLILVFMMNGGISPALGGMIGEPLEFIAWLSYGRWMAEDLYLGHTMNMTGVFRTYPAAYRNDYDSLMAQNAKSMYSDGPARCQLDDWKDADWCYHNNGDDEQDDDDDTPDAGMRRLEGKDDNAPATMYINMNLFMLFILGLVFRMLSFAAMKLCNRNKFGKLSINQLFKFYVVHPLWKNYLSRFDKEFHSQLKRLEEDVKHTSVDFRKTFERSFSGRDLKASKPLPPITPMQDEEAGKAEVAGAVVESAL